MCLIPPDIFTLLLSYVYGNIEAARVFGNIIVAIFSYGVEVYQSVALDEKPHFTILFIYLSSKLHMFVRAIGEIMKP